MEYSKRVFWVMLLFVLVFCACSASKNPSATQPAKVTGTPGFTEEIEIKKAQPLVSKVIVSQGAAGTVITWHTSFPTGTKGHVIIETGLPGDLVGILPLPAVTRGKIPYTISQNGVFTKVITDMGHKKGKVWYCLYVGDNGFWQQTNQGSSAIHKAWGKNPFVWKITEDQVHRLLKAMETASGGDFTGLDESERYMWGYKAIFVAASEFPIKADRKWTDNKGNLIDSPIQEVKEPEVVTIAKEPEVVTIAPEEVQKIIEEGNQELEKNANTRKHDGVLTNESFGYPDKPEEQGYGFKDSGSSSGSGSVSVKGYTRKDGTYVNPHSRSKPRSKGN